MRGVRLFARRPCAPVRGRPATQTHALCASPLSCIPSLSRPLSPMCLSSGAPFRAARSQLVAPRRNADAVRALAPPHDDSSSIAWLFEQRKQRANLGPLAFGVFVFFPALRILFIVAATRLPRFRSRKRRLWLGVVLNRIVLQSRRSEQNLVRWKAPAAQPPGPCAGPRAELDDANASRTSPYWPPTARASSVTRHNQRPFR